MAEFGNSSSTSDGSVDEVDAESMAPNNNNAERPPTFAETRIQEELILGLVRQADALGTTSLDLCHKGMTHIPEDILQLENLEYLYLEGNQIVSLPDEFFEKLSNLQWLDLRENHLRSLPSVYTGRHTKLRDLLLQGNSLRSLPLELGLIKSLNGLNISHNPLQFPPAEVIEQGTKEILRFLREVLIAKSELRVSNGTDNNGEPKIETLKIGDQLDDDDQSDVWQSDEDWQNYCKLRHRSMSDSSRHSATSEHSDLVGPVPLTAELHRPVSYSEMRAQHLEKLKKAGADGKKDLRKKSSSKWRMVNRYPSPPSDTYVNFKMAEERKQAKEKELKIRQDAILQRRRDEEQLKEWRDDTRKQQQKKYFDTLRKGTKDYEDPVKQAPFGIDNEHLRVITNEERIKQDVKATHERMRSRTMTPGERIKVEEDKANRIKELERRIKSHTLQMVERRRRPKGTPQEEMVLAKRELEKAEELQKELSYKRRNMEYRFRAFTGDLVNTREATKIGH